MLDFWLRLRQHRLEAAAAFWPLLLLVSPGVLAAAYVYPLLVCTVGGTALFGHGAAAGAGLGAGLAFALRGFSTEARVVWWACVFCLLLTGGAVAVQLNGDEPDAERRIVASRVLERPARAHLGRRSERAVRRLGLRSVTADFEGRPERIAVDAELALHTAEGDTLLLSVYEGRFGFPVIEDVRRSAAGVR